MPIQPETYCDAAHNSENNVSEPCSGYMNKLLYFQKAYKDDYQLYNTGKIIQNIEFLRPADLKSKEKDKSAIQGKNGTFVLGLEAYAAKYRCTGVKYYV